MSTWASLAMHTYTPPLPSDHCLTVTFTSIRYRWLHSLCSSLSPSIDGNRGKRSRWMIAGPLPKCLKEPIGPLKLEQFQCYGALLMAQDSTLNAILCMSRAPPCAVRIIHIKPGGFTTVNVLDGASGSNPPDGLTVKLEQRGLRSLRFSPDGLFFAFLCDKRVGCLQTMQPVPQSPKSRAKGRSRRSLSAQAWPPADMASEQMEQQGCVVGLEKDIKMHACPHTCTRSTHTQRLLK